MRRPTTAEAVLAASYPPSAENELFGASQRGELRNVQALLRAGAHADSSWDRATGWTALNAALIGGHNRVAEALLDAGASVDTRDLRGNTPIHSCAAGVSGEPGAHPALIPRWSGAGPALFRRPSGARPAPVPHSTPRSSRARPVPPAPSRGSQSIAHDSTPVRALRSCLWQAAAVDGDEVGIVLARRLLSADGAPTAGVANQEGVTPLHLASQRGKRQLIRLLVEYGAPLTAKDRGSRDPYHYRADAATERVLLELISEAVSARGVALSAEFAGCGGSAG